MHIAMFLDTNFPPDSRVENEAVSLIGEGHRVSLFCLNYSDLAPVENVNGIEVYRYPAGKWLYKLSALAYSVPFFHWLVKAKIRRFLSKVKPDSVHVHDMVLARPVLNEAHKAGLNVVVDLHENRPVIMREYVHVKKWPGKWMIYPRIWEKAQRKIVEDSDRVIVVTEEARKELLQKTVIDPKRVIVVPNTIHDDLYLAYHLDEVIIEKYREGFNILYMGDTGLRRGTDTAIQAIALLKDVILNIRLILVGQNTEDIQLKAMVRELRLTDYVEFEGWQDVKLFPSYGQVASVCISPLKRNLHHDTTFANKIFQYMASARPLIVSDCTAQARVISETGSGLIHMASNPASLAEKLLWVYEHPEAAKEMGEHGLRAVKNTWNWRVTSKELIRLYASFTEKRK